MVNRKAPDMQGDLAELYSAVLADIMDDQGYRNQAMHSHIRPLSSGMRLWGRAKTVLCVGVAQIPAEPYTKEMESVDTVRPGEVMVVAADCGHGAYWGELLATATAARGGVGAVIDGLCRDSVKLKNMGFPVFCKGLDPCDSKGRLDVVAYDVPIHCGGVLVQPQDFVMADEDGVVVVPRQILEETVRRALEKVRGEDAMRLDLKAGMSIRDAFRKHKIL